MEVLVFVPESGLQRIKGSWQLTFGCFSKSLTSASASAFNIHASRDALLQRVLDLYNDQLRMSPRSLHGSSLKRKGRYWGPSMGNKCPLEVKMDAKRESESNSNLGSPVPCKCFT